MIGYLLDTNVLSELHKPTPDAGVLRWYDSVRDEQLFLSVLTLGEIRSGIARVVDSRLRLAMELEQWLQETGS